MITLRYHVISLAAVLLALAAGIALGAGLLDESDAVTTASDSNRAEVSPALAGFDAGYATLTSPGLLRDKLKGRTVLLLTTPGARDNEVDSLIENLTTSGAQVTGQVELTAKLLSPSNRQFAEGVATQSDPQAATASSAYDKIGTAIARGYLAAKGDGALDETSRTIRSAFVEGGLLDPDQDPDRSAQLALVVSGPSGASAGGEGTVVSSLVTSLDAGSQGVAVVGPVSSGENGVVNAVRGSDAAANVSTVDVTDTGTGRVSAILALVREAAGQSGAWGTSRAADGPVPN
ncbi:copper transporter [Aeromicrobium senzhongii]|uniref:Copper transporter n=1 Tax=Aeromicrobium senzhongii TaxID=2663859 RepID=A0A8I0ESN0_9ACTN|nr:MULTISPECIES: copper transporter [Aeromicrobium]MBC9224696.1 copper transporter [Aeromicrobium senzhongii]QNL93409.1 copper transporter [Aeromicrobium senzhongii]